MRQGPNGPYQRKCYGILRVLYVREVIDGQPRGWRAVGTVCLRCHGVELDEESLPPERPRGPAAL
jgi:hypothetical protein